MRTRGFTLVEVLVVVAIIAVLIGLLIPTLARARDAARAAACASNARQLTTANLSYANEHRGRLAPGAENFRANLDRWHGTRDSINEPFQPTGGPLSPYLGPDGAVRRCPSFVVNDPNPATDFEANSGGYGYNQVYLGVDRDRDDQSGVELSAIRNAERTVMFADAAVALPHPTERLIEYSFVDPPRSRDRPEHWLDPSTHFRHAVGANVTWVDGSVRPAEFAHTRDNIYGVPEASLRRMRVGWFGPTDNSLFDLD